jgi:phosphoglycolate phosphatase-like HAD superfamily hydrolase
MHDSIAVNQISRDQTQNELKIPFSELRLLLWDIDGTLMHSTVRGGYKKYFSATMQKIFGSAGKLDHLIPSGMTDTQIMYEALREEGFAPEHIFERKTELLEIFRDEMTTVLAQDGEPYERLAGAREILVETDKDPHFINALLTGNLSVAAEIKLKSVGLWHFFEKAPNAFGEISHNRADLATEAGKLFNKRYEFEFSPKQFIVVGDTPNDIKCARALGAKVIALGTGRGHSAEELLQYEPDYFLEDLRETRQVLKILQTL